MTIQRHESVSLKGDRPAAGQSQPRRDVPDQAAIAERSCAFLSLDSWNRVSSHTIALEDTEDLVACIFTI